MVLLVVLLFSPSGQLFIFVHLHVRQLSQEGDDIPDYRIAMGRTPGRHGSRPDTVLDDPELARG